MAESEDRGIHPEVMRHIVDLHRKHAELQLQMHDKDGDDDGQIEHLTKCVDENTAALKEQTGVLKELLAVMKEDVKTDRAVAESGRGKRGSASSAS